jgi:hypothetical protein
VREYRRVLKDGLVSATLVLFDLNETRGVDWWGGREEERKENAESKDETRQTRQDKTGSAVSCLGGPLKYHFHFYNI